MTARPPNDRRQTSCIVHELLEKHDGVPTRDHAQSYEGLAQERLMDKDPHSHAEETQNSRLLTKKQISDMAFGIRELYKKLAQIRLKLHIKNIFILGKAHDESLIKNTRETVEWLLMKDPDYKIYVEQTLEDNKIFDKKSLLERDSSYEGRLKFWTNELAEQKPQTFDIVLAVSKVACPLQALTDTISLVETEPFCTRLGSSSASYHPSFHSPSDRWVSSPSSISTSIRKFSHKHSQKESLSTYGYGSRRPSCGHRHETVRVSQTWWNS